MYCVNVYLYGVSIDTRDSCEGTLLRSITAEDSTIGTTTVGRDEGHDINYRCAASHSNCVELKKIK